MLDNIRTSIMYLAQTIDYGELPKRAADQDFLEQLLSIVLGIIGAVAIIMIIIGGIQYASSQGDPQSTSRAKKTVLYALIGLVLAVFARVIVGFVVGRVA